MCIRDRIITITDNGIGMSEEFQKRIFETFERERNTTSSRIEGSGIGMGITKKLVELMDGTIEVKSKQGEGSTFTVTIPCRKSSKEDSLVKRNSNLSNNCLLYTSGGKLGESTNKRSFL